jgi:hypothetical protein
VDRPPFPQLHYDELQRIVRLEAPELADLAGTVGCDWLDDADAEALAIVALNYFLGDQLGCDSEPLSNIDILGDEISALIEQQRRSFWE